MGKSYNRNQDKYNKWDRERKQRDHKKNKFKNNSGKKGLPDENDRASVSAFSDESTY